MGWNNHDCHKTCGCLSVTFTNASLKQQSATVLPFTDGSLQPLDTNLTDFDSFKLAILRRNPKLC